MYAHENFDDEKFAHKKFDNENFAHEKVLPWKSLATKSRLTESLHTKKFAHIKAHEQENFCLRKDWSGNVFPRKVRLWMFFECDWKWLAKNLAFPNEIRGILACLAPKIAIFN